MNDLPRRTISELVARYELEPSVSDVFVEGAFDKTLLTQCIKAQGVSAPIVYEIETVEVPDRLLEIHGFTTGNKQRVITLARELSAESDRYGVRCIVDRDLDHWFGELEKTTYLWWTQYCSVELYFFEAAFLNEILLIVSKSKIADWKGFFKSFSDVLWALYCLRLADRELDLSLNWVSTRKCLDISNDRITFDVSGYITRLLSATGAMKRKGKFQESFKEWHSSPPNDPRNGIRGHDFVDLLTFVIRKTGGLKTFADPEAIESLFLLCAKDRDELVVLIS